MSGWRVRSFCRLTRHSRPDIAGLWGVGGGGGSGGDDNGGSGVGGCVGGDSSGGGGGSGIGGNNVSFIVSFIFFW